MRHFVPCWRVTVLACAVVLLATAAINGEEIKQPWRAAFDPDGVSVEPSPPFEATEAVQLLESFTGDTFPPTGWTELIVNDPGTDPDWSRVTTGTSPTIAPHTAPAMAKFNSYNATNLASARLATPVLDLSAVVAPSLKFWMSHYSGSPTLDDRVTIQISTDGGTTWTVDAATFSRYDATCTTACWQEHAVDLSAYVGQPTVSIGFLGISAYGYNFFIDDVMVAEPAPNLSTSTKTAPAAILEDGEIAYTVNIVNTGTASANAATMVDVLPPDTTYVPGSVSCTSGVCSYNVGLNQIEFSGTVPLAGTVTVAFAVDTDAVPCNSVLTNTAVINDPDLIGGAINVSALTTVVYVFPVLSESFTGTTFPPTGWAQVIVVDPGTDPVWTRETAGTYPTIAPHSPPAMTKFNSFSTGSTGSARLSTPSFALTGVTLPVLGFWMSHDTGYSGNADLIQVQVSTDAGTTWGDLGDPILRYNAACSTPCWTQHQLDLSAYSGLPDVRIGLLGVSAYGNNIFVDDVVIAEPWYPCPYLSFGPDYLGGACNGEILPYGLTVVNGYYTTDTVDLIPTNLWPTSVTPDSFTLPPGGSGVSEVTVTIPWASLGGDYDIASITATGQTSGLTDTATIRTFAAIAGTYTDYADVPADDGHRVRDHSVVYYDGKLYKIGGYGGATGAARAFVDVYDIATDTWSAMDPLPGARYGIDCVEISGKIYCAGGYSTSLQTTLYIFDPAAAPGAQWTTGAAMPSGRYNYGGVALDGLYYVLGGYSTSYQSTVLIYDPVSNTWDSTAPNMSAARRYPLAGAIGGNVVVTGGATASGSYTNTTEAFDPVTRTWSPRAPLPFPGWVRTADGVIDDRFLLITGGYSADATASTWVIAYDALNDLWDAPQPYMPHLLYGMEGDTDAEGNFWFASGRLYEGGVFSYSNYTEKVTGCPPCTEAFNADFTVDPLLPVINEPATFTAASDGSPAFVFTWDFGDGGTAEGEIVEHTYTADGTFIVTLTVTNCDGVGTTSVSRPVFVAPVADLSVVKTDGVTQVLPGDPLTYTITVSNVGPSAVTGASVIDTFPADLLNVTWTCTGTGAALCTAAGAGNINDLADIPSGESVIYTATGTVDPDAKGMLIDGRPSLVNTANVFPPGGATDPNVGNNSSTDIDEIVYLADVAITKDDGVTELIPGDPVTYTITVANLGPGDTLGAIVTDAFPAAILNVNWTCVGSGGGICAASGSGNLVDVATLPFGGSVVYTATGTVDLGATGTIDNTANVAVTDVTDPNVGNNSATDSDTVGVPPLPFADGFETGDTSRWSLTVP